MTNNLYLCSALRDLDPTKLATSIHSEVAKAGRFAVGRSLLSSSTSLQTSTCTVPLEHGSSSSEVVKSILIDSCWRLKYNQKCISGIIHLCNLPEKVRLDSPKVGATMSSSSPTEAVAELCDCPAFWKNFRSDIIIICGC